MRIRRTMCVMTIMLVATAGSAFAQGAPCPMKGTSQDCPMVMPCDEFAHIDSPEFDSPLPPPGMAPGTPPPGRGPGMGDRRGFERLRMAKLTELLELKAEQRKPFMEAFRKMRHQQRQIGQRRQQLLEEMSQIVRNERPDEGALSAKADELTSLEHERFAGMDEFVRTTRAILTPTQVAKLAIFQDRFEAAALRMVRERMHHPGGPGGPNRQVDSDGTLDRP